MSILHSITPLTQEQRLSATERAKKAIIQSIGEKPSVLQFEGHSNDRFPPYVTKSIITLCVLALVAAFIPSAIRLYHIGSDTFNHSITHQISAQIVGLSVVVMAELSQLVFSLSLAVLGTSKASRRLLYFSMFTATLIALVGNVQVALPGHWMNPFAWLEAIAPPVLVLSLAYILKEQMLVTIEQRYETERMYQEALQGWEKQTAKPENHPNWKQFYANSIRDEFIGLYKRRKSVDVKSLGSGEWIEIVKREFNADQWYMPESNIEDNTIALNTAKQLEAEVISEDTPLAMKNGHNPN